MHPDAQRRLEARLDDDGYSCEKFCGELPYTFWNTCPLCLCGLMPVLVVCFSALFRLDYATHVTDIGAQIINEIGLSYTVYYTAGCWPGPGTEDPSTLGVAGLRGGLGATGSPLHQPRCNSEHFEVAAGEFDALSGSLLRVRNVTKLHARRVEAVKVSPDWRYIVFVGALANDVGNLYAVGAEETDATRAVQLLSEEQLDALDAHCQAQSAEVLEAQDSDESADDEGTTFFNKVGNNLEEVSEADFAGEVPEGNDTNSEKAQEAEEVQEELEEDEDPEQDSDVEEGAAAVSTTGAPEAPVQTSTAAPTTTSAVSKATSSKAGTKDAAVANVSGAKPEDSSAASEDVEPLEENDEDEDPDDGLGSDDSTDGASGGRSGPSPAASAVAVTDADTDGGPPEGPPPKPARKRALRDGPAPVARLVGFKHLQVVIPGLAPVERGGELDQASLPDLLEGSSLRYRAAFAFQCTQKDLGGSSGSDSKPLTFSQIATLDFQLLGINASSTTRARSRLNILSVAPAAPAGAGPAAAKAVARFKSQSCPRFVPSRQGHEVLFVAEDVLPPPSPTMSSQLWSAAALLPSRWLAVAAVADEGEAAGDNSDLEETDGTCCQQAVARCLACLAGKTLRAFCSGAESQGVPGCDQATPSSNATAALLDVGEGALPFAPVHGCPEFVPSLYYTTQSLTETVQDNLFKSPDSRARAQLEEKKFRDTFVILSDPTSMSVLGVDAQVLAVSLPEGPLTGAVSRVHLLYNVDNAPAGPDGERSKQLLLGGCQPIRAAGRKGHMRLQWALEMVMSTLQLRTEKNGYTAWLACLTADQRIAIVESPKREHWINMSMPYPLWTGKASQAVWCPEDRVDGCFEVWSNPNPNE